MANIIRQLFNRISGDKIFPVTHTNAVIDDSGLSLTTRLSQKADISSLATVATSGDYEDLDNTPDIVPPYRRINGKALSSDITLTASDVGAVPIAISTTYNDLVTTVANSQLVKGAWYRITDYVCTTAQTDTHSAGHQFDILVQAVSPNKLSEEARATRHEGDTYFANSNLEAWKIWYCLDNDVTRFAWAEPAEGKGVIYRMIDEWGNDCPYDFKNIQFKRWAITDITSSTLNGDVLNDLKNAYVFSSNGGKHFAAKNSYGNWIPSSQGITITVDENSFGWYYTFNGMSSENGETISETYDVSTHHFKVTQDCIDYVINEDGSGLNTQDICFDNKVLEFIQEHIGDDLYSKGRYVLNNIVFINGLSFCYSYEDDGHWEYSTAECYGNEFKSNCNSNTFGNNACGNIFKNGCNSNTFVNDCRRNSFGNGCHNNSFGNDCWNNSFGNDCWHNTFGNGCHNNSFGNYCYYNTFGYSCADNIFGNNCNFNTFGNRCRSNIFGDNCRSNGFRNDCNSNTFGNDINYVTFSKDYTYCVIIENGNQFITLTSTKATSSSNQLRNITIAQGVNNTNTTKTISHNTLNDTFRTTYTTDVNGNIYAIAPAKYNEWDNKQSTLVSGTNIKTINNQSLLGNGNIEIESGGNVTVENVTDTGDVIKSLEPNIFYKFGTVNSLTIPLISGTDLAVYSGKFTIDSLSTALSFFVVPATVITAYSCPTITAGNTYEFNILDNVLMMQEI